MAMKLLLVISLIISSFSSATSYDATCCDEGLRYGEEVFKGNKAHCVDDTKKRNAYCKMLFKQCCQHKMDNTYCDVGRAISLANMFCVEASSDSDRHREVQLTCCECCNRGKLAGLSKKSCDVSGEQQYCRLSYKSCCEEVKKGNKQTTPTTPYKTTSTTPQPTTTSTTRRILGRTCDQVTCDPATSLGCHITDDGVARCKCKADHYSYARFICKQTDDCQRKNGKNCGRNFCMIVKGRARCYLNCPSPRYRATFISGGRRQCEDVDECALKTSRCNLKTQDCINIVGGYRCVNARCAEGLKMQNGVCVDINECAENLNICGNGNCKNYRGSYFCHCRDGYILDKNTKKCVDINECSLQRRQYCDYQCTNTEGSFSCKCPNGYRLVGEDCIDVNECRRTPNICQKNSYCFNTYGSYMCINQTCPDPQYYTQDSVKGEPDSCNKVCVEAPASKKVTCNLGRTPQSIKQITYRYEKSIGIGGFIYKYWWNFPPHQYHTDITLVQGNHRNEFEVQYMTNQRIKIINIVKIEGPRRIHMRMRMDIKRKNRGSPLLYRYITEFYIDVSEYDFSQR